MLNKPNYFFSEYINFQGIWKTIKYLKNIKSLKPDIITDHIGSLVLKSLKQDKKIKYIIFDKDNTIAYHKSNDIPNDSIKEILKNFSFHFGDENIAVLSNTAGSASDKNFSDLKLIEENFGIKVIRHKNKKPCVDKEIFAHFKLSDNPSQSVRRSICIIGDRLFTDVVMGKEINSFTVLVNPLDPSTDNFLVKNIRKIENLLIEKYMI